VVIGGGHCSGRHAACTHTVTSWKHLLLLLLVVVFVVGV
jgi:hypothetical protein